MNVIDPNIVPAGAASDSNNWVTAEDRIELSRGKLLIGALETGNTPVRGLHVAYRVDGTAVFFRRQTTKVQYYNTATELWADTITGLTSGNEMTFCNYQSLAGSFVYAVGPEGIWKIATANPASSLSVYSASKNYKGYAIIDTARMFLWNRIEDRTGLYMSYIDSATYTTVTAEALGDTATGTLAARTGTRTVFAVSITDTSSGEVFTDNYNGTLTGSLGGTGTINYVTGAFTTSQSGAGTATYQWEDSNAGGVTDFTFSGTRLAGQGDLFRQDVGGDRIQTVLVQDGRYYSIKARSVYELDLTADDRNATNLVFLKDIGCQFFRSAVATSLGMVLLDTSNPDKPKLSRLERNLAGDNLVPNDLAPQFDFSAFVWDACAMETWGENIVFTGRTSDSTNNNRLFLYNARLKTIDIFNFEATVLMKNAGLLYAGDALSENVYNLFSGFDDDGFNIENNWDGNAERFGFEELKRFRYLVFRGQISPDQNIEVYQSYDNDDYQLVGTIRGDGNYVDTANPYTIGSTAVGSAEIGGGGDGVTAYDYFHSFRVRTPKFYQRRIRFKATGTGYCSISFHKDQDILLSGSGNKIPKKYRVGPVNTAGTEI